MEWPAHLPLVGGGGVSRRVECGCMVLSFIVLGGCVVSSEMGPRPKSRLMVV